MDIIKKLAEEFKIKVEQVEKTVALIDDGNTIPFISVEIVPINPVL